MDPFGSLGGHYGLQTALEVRSDLRFEISDLNCLLIYVHIAYMVWTLLAASEATTRRCSFAFIPNAIAI